ncbi:MAG: YeiH family protein [Planctomycetia bacterium]
MTTADQRNDDAGASEVVSAPRSAWSDLWRLEDWLAVWVGFTILLGCLAVVRYPTDPDDRLTTKIAGWVATPSVWIDDPRDAFFRKGKDYLAPGMAAVYFATLFLFAAAAGAAGRGALSASAFLRAYPPVFLLALLSFLLSEQAAIKYYNLEFPLFALLVGLAIGNTIGTPEAWKPAARTEFYIKTGLVLLGAEVLFGKLLALGLPGVFVSWATTPVVFVGTYLFGQYVLKMTSKSLNLVISADMSVCGVSAAIATAAACRAKKEELSLAIGISLAFTAVMMVVQPAVCVAVGMNPVVAGAWIGGTIDSTGAVAAAGALLDKDGGKIALETATTVKMIQNILIGVVAFGVSVYWVTFVEKGAGGAKPSLWEIWRRFPKFIFGFLGASILFSFLYANAERGPELVDLVTKSGTVDLRKWCFCLAFVSIGLETNFRELAGCLRGGKALTLYIVGQSFSLVLSLVMAYLMFMVVFPDAANSIAGAAGGK